MLLVAWVQWKGVAGACGVCVHLWEMELVRAVWPQLEEQALEG